MQAITIIGGGFGGVYTARYLLSWGFRVRLISRDDFFTFTPLLHEVAAGTLRREDVAFPFKTFFTDPAFEYVRGTVVSIDTEGKAIGLASGASMRYETLVIASGSRADNGAIRHVEDSLSLKTIEDAVAIRCALERAAAQGRVRVAVIGAGPTGVELICEISQLLRSKPVAHVSFDLFSGRHLPFESQHPRIAGYMARTLEELRIAFHPNSIVERIERGIIHTQGGETAADIVILATGVRPATDFMPASFKDSHGNILVDEHLRVIGTPDVFALGDIITLPSGKPLSLAQLAVKQAKIVGLNIRRVSSGESLEAYRVEVAGILMSLGKWNAVGVVAGRFMSGRIAWYIWRTVYLFKTPGWKNRLRIAWRWTIYLFDSRGYFRITKK